MKQGFLTVLLLLTFSMITDLYAQSGQTVYNGVVYRSPEEANAARATDTAQRNARGPRAPFDPFGVGTQRNPPQVGRADSTFNRDFIEGPLKVKKDRRAAYAEFLKQKGTGIFQLVPEEKCGAVVRNGKEKFLSPESAYFWFARQVHFKAWADLMLREGQFLTSIGFTSLGSLKAIGDTAIESVTLDHPVVKELAAISIPKTQEEVATRKMGMDRSAPLKLNETYVLRSAMVTGPDLLVVFRVVEIAPEGNALIVWKRWMNIKALKPTK